MDKGEPATQEKVAALLHGQWARNMDMVLGALLEHGRGGKMRLKWNAPEMVAAWRVRMAMEYPSLTKAQKAIYDADAATIMMALGRMPGDDIISQSDWAWVLVTIDSLPEGEPLGPHLAARFGTEKAEELQAFVMGVDIEGLHPGG